MPKIRSFIYLLLYSRSRECRVPTTTRKKPQKDGFNTRARVSSKLTKQHGTTKIQANGNPAREIEKGRDRDGRNSSSNFKWCTFILLYITHNEITKWCITKFGSSGWVRFICHLIDRIGKIFKNFAGHFLEF